MAIQWIRLRHDMPNDPKWRSIAHAAGESISSVMAVYIHLILGNSDFIDIATKLEISEPAVLAILDAMEGRIAEHGVMTGKYAPTGLIVEGRISGDEWSRMRQVVFERDNFKCTYCGLQSFRLECDHIFPVCRGGSSHIDNLTTACYDCNRSKGKKTITEWRARA